MADQRRCFRWYWFLELQVLLALLITGWCVSELFIDDRRLRFVLVAATTAASATLTLVMSISHFVSERRGRPLSCSGPCFKIMWISYSVGGILILLYLRLR
jgi:hypothetical protein